MIYFNFQTVLISHINYIIPDDTQIESLLEKHGYDYYFPKILFSFLISRISHERFHSTPKYHCVTDFDNLVKDLLETIPYHIYLCGHTVAEAAILILLDLVDKIDFRNFENEEEFSNSIDNGETTLRDIPPDIKEALHSRYKNAETDKLRNMLCALNELTFTVGASNKKEIVLRSKKIMSSYTQITRCSILEYARPDFNIRLLTKRNIIKSSNSTFKSTSHDVVVVIDTSSSMYKYDYVIHSVLAYLAKYEGTITIYQVSPFRHKCDILENKQDLIDYINAPMYFTEGCIKDYNELITKVSESQKDIVDLILVTDGEDDFNFKLPSNVKLNVVCVKEDNDYLKTMSINSNGKYIKF